MGKPPCTNHLSLCQHPLLIRISCGHLDPRGISNVVHPEKKENCRKKGQCIHQLGKLFLGTLFFFFLLCVKVRKELKTLLLVKEKNSCLCIVVLFPVFCLVFYFLVPKQKYFFVFHSFNSQELRHTKKACCFLSVRQKKPCPRSLDLSYVCGNRHTFAVTETRSLVSL